MFVFIPNVFDLAVHRVSTRFAVISSVVDLYTSEECCIVLHCVMRRVLLHISGYSKQSSLVLIQGPATQQMAKKTASFLTNMLSTIIYIMRRRKNTDLCLHIGDRGACLCSTVEPLLGLLKEDKACIIKHSKSRAADLFLIKVNKTVPVLLL